MAGREFPKSKFLHFGPFALAIALFFSLGPNPQAMAQVSQKMTLLSNWDNPNLPILSNLVYNEVWGWYDAVKKREYAIIGSLQRTYFIDVTDPYNPVVCDSVEGTYGGCIHRDFKHYQKYCYGVADEGNSTFQIMDMSYLPDSVHKVYDTNLFFQRCHNVFIDTASGRLYAAGCNTQPNGLIIFDIATNPESPAVILDSNLGNYTHDLYVRNDTAYLDNGNAGLKVWDFSNINSPVALAQLSAYPDKGYNHSSWMSEDFNYLVMCDETHNMRIKVVDIQNLSNLNVVGMFKSTLLAPADTQSIPHNPLVAGNYACISYYHDGVQLFDISDPANPVHWAWYDTDNISTNYGGYNGAWGVHPYLPSATILGSDTRNGLFVLRANFPFPWPLSTNLEITNVTCNGAADGIAKSIAKGGTSPYSYLWSTGDTIAFVSGLDTGMHTVQITDVYGNSLTDTFYISQQAPILTSALIINESCPGVNDGSIDFTIAGGAQPYVFSWSTGAATEDISGLGSGTYIINVSDSVNCMMADTFTVGADNSLQAAAGSDTSICSKSYSMNATLSPGAAGAWTQINGNASQISDTTNPQATVAFVAAGTHIYLWSATLGTCVLNDTVSVVVDPGSLADAGPDDIVCIAAGALFAIPGNPASGLWTILSGFGNIGSPSAAASSVGNISPGMNYFLWTLTNGNCSSSDTAMIWFQQTINAGFTYNGSVLTVNFTDTTAGGISWSWDFGDGNVSSLSAPSHTYASPGLYLVCLTVSNTCRTDTVCKEIEVPLVGGDPVLYGMKFELFPNPNEGEFRLQGNLPLWSSAQIEVYDMLGRLQREDEIFGNGNGILAEVELGETGIFVVAVRAHGKVWTGMVVVR